MLKKMKCLEGNRDYPGYKIKSAFSESHHFVQTGGSLYIAYSGIFTTMETQPVQKMLSITGKRSPLSQGDQTKRKFEIVFRRGPCVCFPSNPFL